VYIQILLECNPEHTSQPPGLPCCAGKERWLGGRLSHRHNTSPSSHCNEFAVSGELMAGSGPLLVRVGHCKVTKIDRTAPKMAPLLKLLARRIGGKKFEVIFKPGF